MKTREIALHAFCSAKGGVGKTTLAVASAIILAKRDGCSPVLIDADLTGTSLADGLCIVAPKILQDQEQGLILNESPATLHYYTLKETFNLRRERSRLIIEKGDDYTGQAMCIPFLNDALSYEKSKFGRECQIDSLLWRHVQDDGVRYLPSSSLAEDAALALGWLYAQDRPDLFLLRFCWLLDELLSRISHLSDIIIDLPPGLLGITQQVLELMRYLDEGEKLPTGYPEWSGRFHFRVNPLLIMTPDRNDWLAAMEYFFRYRSPLAVRLNRTDTYQDVERIIIDISEEFGDVKDALREEIQSVPYISTLARLFRKDCGQLNFDSALEPLIKILRLWT